MLSYISLYKSWSFKLTNITEGGEGFECGGLNLGNTIESRLKKSLKLKGRIFNEKWKKNLCIAQRKLRDNGFKGSGNKSIRTKENREKVSSALKGRSWIEKYGEVKALELRKKTSKVQKDKIVSVKTRQLLREKAINRNTSRSIKQFTKENEFIKLWKNRQEMLKVYTKNQIKSIGAVCRGKEKSMYGFKWEYVE